ncbi:response regulator [Novosphingobium pentaromativorans]|uniref:histidine kinase n=1 Tax=Novosphingobium pentaromativorans US6-1 TaxID=1088721 RepID=G6EG25_9SPHN|nr:response regulator [Novosphingobium pentaromativorans]AIT82280.1 regulator [Novosphingobium pentaromativorans US6-1]EHJ59714.1 signal transduction histidine kinase [Novosphingobium pentaromativorans US6-1]
MHPDPIRILAVDDIAENLVALDALLADGEVEILQARSGEEALELLLCHDVALALLDVQMPGMDGFELAELMRGLERTRSIPILFLTAVATDERRRFRGYEAGAVDYLLKPVDTHILRSKVNVFTELYAQRRELARQRDDLATALARLTAHSDNSPLAIVELDSAQQVIAWSNGAERLFGWRAAEVKGYDASRIDWLSAEDAETFSTLVDKMISGKATRETHTLRFLTTTGQTLTCECYCSAIYDAAGHLISVNLQILDITDRVRAEEAQRLLNGELNHRVKNTLATVQAISRQTLRFSSGPDDFSTTFLGRIDALAKAHSLLSNATWQGADLRQLIAGQVAIGTFDPARVSVEGPDVDLGSEPALHLALVLHELVTNAHKYGALSGTHGMVSLTWRILDDKLKLDWIERGGPPVQLPARTGFGTTMIERSLAADGGSAAMHADPAGMKWELVLPCPASAKAARKQPGTHAETMQAPEVAAPANTLANTRLFIIEDEPLVAMELMTIIEDAGGEVAGSASSVAAALDLIEHKQADGAVLDGNLRGQSVEAVAAQLRARRIPFAFVSGYGRENLPSGYDEAPLLSKPFRPDLIVSTISAFASLENHE